MEPEVILAFQSVLLVPFFVSMALRMKGKYLVHGIIMIVLAAIGWIAFLGSTTMMDASFSETYMSQSSTLVVFGLHGFFGIVALISVTWLVALWRPRSTEFAAKSKRIWQLTVISWISAFVVGLLLYVALTTTLFA
jgi:hypothetical protein